MRTQFGQAYQWLELTATATRYLNRATALDDLLLVNSERPSIPAPHAMPDNSAVGLYAAAYRDPDPAATPVKWANRLTAGGDPLPLTLLANTALPSIVAQTGVPINEMLRPLETG
jgi:hypothetical protein